MFIAKIREINKAPMHTNLTIMSILVIARHFDESVYYPSKGNILIF